MHLHCNLGHFQTKHKETYLERFQTSKMEPVAYLRGCVEYDRTALETNTLFYPTIKRHYYVSILLQMSIEAAKIINKESFDDNNSCKSQ